MPIVLIFAAIIIRKGIGPHRIIYPMKQYYTNLSLPGKPSPLFLRRRLNGSSHQIINIVLQSMVIS